MYAVLNSKLIKPRVPRGTNLGFYVTYYCWHVDVKCLRVKVLRVMFFQRFSFMHMIKVFGMLLLIQLSLFSK